MTKIIVITGPTAVGKSDIAMQAAQFFNGEIISADSMQVYQGMDIGTAKPTLAEQQLVRHHLIDILSVEQDFDVMQFRHHAQAAINQIQAKEKVPFLVGGTGFYLKALLENYDLEPVPHNQKLRAKLNQKAQNKSKTYLYQLLREVDPDYAQKIHPNDIRRVVRALEVFYLTKRPFSQFQKKTNNKNSPYQILGFLLLRNRQELYQRINLRVEKMIDQGLINETKKILAQNPSKTATQSLGYREAIYFLRGLVTSDEMKRLLKRNTRHFAKRQLTWFRHQLNLNQYELSLDCSSIHNKIFSQIAGFLKSD